MRNFLKRLRTSSEQGFTKFKESFEQPHGAGPTDEAPGGSYAGGDGGGDDPGDHGESSIGRRSSRVDLSEPESVRTVFINEPVCLLTPPSFPLCGNILVHARICTPSFSRPNLARPSHAVFRTLVSRLLSDLGIVTASTAHVHIGREATLE